MNMLFYRPGTNATGKELQSLIEAQVPQVKTDIYRTMDSLSRRLRQPGREWDAAVLLAATREDLSDILSIRKLLGDVRIILILPDREEHTVAEGHRLRPRFLTYTDSDLGEVTSVLKKMLGQ